ncbi:MAG TPA: hypothetical protein VFD70_02185 [Anaerolineae bacterium]|nr:hypothetical protein [Anaerolineae bacterium]
MKSVYVVFPEREQVRVEGEMVAPQVYEMLRRDRSSAIGVIFDWDLIR